MVVLTVVPLRKATFSTVLAVYFKERNPNRDIETETKHEGSVDWATSHPLDVLRYPDIGLAWMEASKMERHYR